MPGYDMAVKVDGKTVGFVMQIGEHWYYRTEPENLASIEDVKKSSWRGGFSTRDMAETELRKLHEERGREAE